MKKKPARTKKSSAFAKNLKAVLEERSVSQRSAGELAGVSVSVVNDWLSGSLPHDLVAVQKLCKGLKVDFEWLLTGEQNRVAAKDVPLSEIFNITEEPDFSGIFEITARRLRKKG